MPKNWWLWTVVLEKILESPLDCMEIQPVHPKGNQCWIFIGRTDAKAETPILWPPDVKNWLTGKDLMLGRLKAGGEGNNRGWDGWMTSLTEWTWVWVTRRVGYGQGGLACCSPWCHEESDMTEQLNWTELIHPTISSFWPDLWKTICYALCFLILNILQLSPPWHLTLQC